MRQSSRCLALLLLASAAVLAGCASPAKMEGMLVAGGLSPPADFALRNRVEVGTVTGGEETNPLWTSEVGNEEFRQALVESLRRSALLPLPGKIAETRLDAHLLEVDQPLIGFDMTVNARVRYELFDRATGARLWNDTVGLGYTATVGQAFLGIERLRLANEGAIRENIRALINLLHRYRDP